MNSRFEQAITAGVLAGAIALAGCASSGGGDGNGDDPLPDAEFLGGRTISATEIELRFSGPVTLGDASAAAGLFTITGNALNFGVESWTTGEGNPLTSKHVTATVTAGSTVASAFYSFTAGSLPIPEVQGATAEDDRVVLTLSAPIPVNADHGTGMLRLTYTGDANGINDADGDAHPDISLGIEERGNVADTVDLGAEGPNLIGARTIDSNRVELIFNEPVVVANESSARTSFAITSNNALRIEGSPIFVDGFFPDSIGAYGADWAAYNTGFTWGSFSDSGVLSISTDSDALTTITNIAVSADAPERLILTLSGAIPADADGGTGRLRVYYTDNVDGAGGIEDADGNVLDTFGYGPRHRGNVDDTID